MNTHLKTKIGSNKDSSLPKFSPAVLIM